MISLKQKLLTKLFRKFRGENIHVGSGSYMPGRKLATNTKTRIIDRIYKTVEKYTDVGYTENDIDIVEYYEMHFGNYSSRESRKNQRQKDINFKNRKLQEKKNLKFIEENELVEHPKYKNYFGKKDGRVFSSKGAYGSIREIKPVYQKYNNGYYLICCGRDENGKTNQVLWHRFIADIFIPNSNNLPEINHIDEDKSNCSVDNLEWSDRVSNIRHSSDNWGSNWIIEDTSLNEKYNIRNLSKWCRENGLKQNNVRNYLSYKRQKPYLGKYIFYKNEDLK